MSPQMLNEMLNRYGVHNLTWRRHVVAEVARLVTFAQMRGFAYGGIVGVTLTLFVQWVAVNP